MPRANRELLQAHLFQRSLNAVAGALWLERRPLVRALFLWCKRHGGATWHGGATCRLALSARVCVCACECVRVFVCVCACMHACACLFECPSGYSLFKLMAKKMKRKRLRLV